MRSTFIALLALVGCSSAHAPAKPCERGAVFEMHAVDNDSDYMKKLYAHVGSEQDGRPSDPKALAMAIRAEIDQWSTDLKNADGMFLEQRRETDYYLMSLDERSLRGYLGSLAQTMPPPSDRRLVIERVEERPELQGNKYLEYREHWRSYLVGASALLDNRALAEVLRDDDRVTHQPVIVFELTDAGREQFATLTAASIGKKIATVIDGAVASAPIINGAIPGGRFNVRFAEVATRDGVATRLACKTR